MNSVHLILLGCIAVMLMVIWDCAGRLRDGNPYKYVDKAICYGGPIFILGSIIGFIVNKPIFLSDMIAVNRNVSIIMIIGIVLVIGATYYKKKKVRKLDVLFTALLALVGLIFIIGLVI